jgi:hypothetical protein
LQQIRYQFARQHRGKDDDEGEDLLPSSFRHSTTTTTAG